MFGRKKIKELKEIVSSLIEENSELRKKCTKLQTENMLMMSRMQNAVYDSIRMREELLRGQDENIVETSTFDMDTIVYLHKSRFG